MKEIIINPELLVFISGIALSFLVICFKIYKNFQTLLKNEFKKINEILEKKL